MTQRYESIVAVDGSKADLAFIKRSSVSVRNQAKLTIAHVIDRALQSISAFDAEVYEELQVEAQELMAEYEKRARDRCFRYSSCYRNGKS